MNSLPVFCLSFLVSCVPLLAQTDPFSACPSPKPATAAAAWQELLKGNDHFRGICDREPCPVAPRRDACRRSCTSKDQSPFAIVLSCADSRVPPEILFDQGIADLFIVRVAGNLATTEAKGSIEYALATFKPAPKLLVVLGHEGCGAAKTAIQYRPPWKGSKELFSVFEPILKAVGDCRDYETCLPQVVERNVDLVVSQLNAFKPVQDAKPGLGVRGAVYDLASGKLKFR
jgi:carbonic anhydrase